MQSKYFFIFIAIVAGGISSTSAKIERDADERYLTLSSSVPDIATNELSTSGGCCSEKVNLPPNFNYLVHIEVHCGVIITTHWGIIVNKTYVLTTGDLLIQSDISAIRVYLPEGKCLSHSFSNVWNTTVEAAWVPSNMLPSNHKLCNNLALLKTKDDLVANGGEIYNLDFSGGCICKHLQGETAKIVGCSEGTEGLLEYQPITVISTSSSFDKQCSQLTINKNGSCNGHLGAPMFHDKTNQVFSLMSHCNGCDLTVGTCIQDYEEFYKSVMRQELKAAITFGKAKEILKCQYSGLEWEYEKLVENINKSGVCDQIKEKLIEHLATYKYNHRGDLKKGSVMRLALREICDCA